MLRSSVTWGRNGCVGGAKPNADSQSHRPSWLACSESGVCSGPAQRMRGAGEDAVTIQGDGAGLQAMVGGGVDEFFGDLLFHGAQEGQRHVQGFRAHGAAMAVRLGLGGPGA